MMTFQLTGSMGTTLDRRTGPWRQLSLTMPDSCLPSWVTTTAKPCRVPRCQTPLTDSTAHLANRQSQKGKALTSLGP